MQLVDVQSRDAYALFEIRQKDLMKLVFCCNHCEVAYNSKSKEEAEAMKYFKDTFFPQITETLKGIEEKYGTASDKKAE